jgi:hypothetical protein
MLGNVVDRAVDETIACVAKGSRSCPWPGHTEAIVASATVGQRKGSWSTTARA